MAQNGTLTRRQTRFVAALLTAGTVEDAAKAAGIAPRTAWRYLATPAVKAELAKRQDGLLGHAARRLASETDLALDTLHGVMVDELKAAPRVSAARAVVDGALKLAELVALAERVTAVEAHLEKEKKR
jgi:phage terminase small subunit